MKNKKSLKSTLAKAIPISLVITVTKDNDLSQAMKITELASLLSKSASLQES